MASLLSAIWRTPRRRRNAPEPQPGGDECRHPAATRSVLTYRTGVSDANVAGDVHGGWIMKLCDDVAVIAATRHSESRVVTLAVDGVLFRSPVTVSNVLTLKATVNAAWRSSMEVGVRVEAEDPRSGRVCHTLTAYLTMVALDGSGKTKQVPRLEPTSAEDVRRRQEAELRRRIRLADLTDLDREIPPADAHSLGNSD